MTEALAIPDQSTAFVPWSHMSAERRALFKQVVNGSGLSDAQLAMLSEVSQRHVLDPALKQIYGIILKGRFVVIVAIDGFRAIANRSGAYAGSDDATHTYAEGDSGKRFPLSSTVTVWKMVHGQRVPFTATARFAEYAKFKEGKPDGNWRVMPHVQLDKCAEALALRKGFTETSGMYEAAEVDHMDGDHGRATVSQPVSAREKLARADAPLPEVHDGEVEPEPYAGDDRDPTDAGAP